MQVPWLFAVILTPVTFSCPKWPRRLFLVFFGCRPNWRTIKAAPLFCCPFGDFLPSKTLKRTAKGHGVFLSPKGCQKVAELILPTNRSARNFGRQKVAYTKRMAKSHGTCIELKYISVPKRQKLVPFHRGPNFHAVLPDCRNIQAGI